jgi:hypothetical protein
LFRFGGGPKGSPFFLEKPGRTNPVLVAVPHRRGTCWYQWSLDATYRIPFAIGGMPAVSGWEGTYQADLIKNFLVGRAASGSAAEMSTDARRLGKPLTFAAITFATTDHRPHMSLFTTKIMRAGTKIRTQATCDRGFEPLWHQAGPAVDASYWRPLWSKPNRENASRPLSLAARLVIAGPFAAGRWKFRSLLLCLGFVYRQNLDVTPEIKKTSGSYTLITHWQCFRQFKLYRRPDLYFRKAEQSHTKRHNLQIGHNSGFRASWDWRSEKSTIISEQLMTDFTLWRSTNRGVTAKIERENTTNFQKCP